MASIAVIGSRSSVTPFKAFGFLVWAVESPDEMRRAWSEALGASQAAGVAAAGEAVGAGQGVGAGEAVGAGVGEGVGVVMLTEPVAEILQDEVREVDSLPAPAGLVIPDSTGPTGYALERIRRMAEMAVGTDILTVKSEG